MHVFNNQKTILFLLLILFSCNKRPSDTVSSDSISSDKVATREVTGNTDNLDDFNGTINKAQNDSISVVQQNYEKSMIHREFNNDSLLLDLPDLKQLFRNFITRSKKVMEKEYGAGDYFGKYRVFVHKLDTLIIDKGDGGDYGFDNEQYLKRRDSLILYRKYKFKNAYWAKVDSITEIVIKFKNGSMIMTRREMSSKDLKELRLGQIKFDTIDTDPTKQYKLLNRRLKQLYQRMLIE